MKVIFSHGKESGPWGSKIKQLASAAKSLGFEVDSIDYQGIESPQDRVCKLLTYIGDDTDVVLVGSSMGGYVSAVAATQRTVSGVFLLAPALYMPGYAEQRYLLDTKVEVVHGWSDTVIPVEHAIRFAKEQNCSLHLIAGDHRLKSALTEVEALFRGFLSGV